MVKKIFIVFTFLIISCSSDENLPIEVEEIMLNISDLELRIDEEVELITFIKPTNAFYDKVGWKSNDTNIVMVDDEGKVSGINIGYAEVTATIGDKIATCKVKVLPKPVIGSWIQKADFGNGIGRFQAVSFVIGEKAYVGLGSDWGSICGVNGEPSTSSGGLRNDFWEYDYRTNHWRKLSNFPGGARQGAIGFSMNGKGYVGFGRNPLNPYQGDPDGAIYKDLWEYNPDTGMWFKMSDFPGARKYDAICFVVKDKAYIGLGSSEMQYYSDSEESRNDLWEYNATNNTWKQLSDFPGGLRDSAISFIIGDKGYVGLGYHKKDLWEYDPQSDIWTRKSDLPERDVPTGYSSVTERYQATGFSFNGRGYAGLGFIDSTPAFGFCSNDFFQYIPEIDHWESVQTLYPHGLVSTINFEVGDNMYIGTGQNISFIGDHCSNFSINKNLYQFIP